MMVAADANNDDDEIINGGRLAMTMIVGGYDAKLS